MPSINSQNVVPVPKLSNYCDENHYRHDAHGDCPECEYIANHKRDPINYPA